MNPINKNNKKPLLKPINLEKIFKMGPLIKKLKLRATKRIIKLVLQIKNSSFWFFETKKYSVKDKKMNKLVQLWVKETIRAKNPAPQ